MVCQQREQQLGKVPVARAFLLGGGQLRLALGPSRSPATGTLPVDVEATALLSVAHPIRRHQDEPRPLNQTIRGPGLVSRPRIEDGPLPG